MCLAREAKIGNLDRRIGLLAREEQVLGLEVAVRLACEVESIALRVAHKVLVMHVLEARECLAHDVRGLLLTVTLQLNDAVKKLATRNTRP